MPSLRNAATGRAVTDTAITLAVCDDDAGFRAKLLRCLPSVPLLPGYRLEPTALVSGLELLSRHKAGERFDIVILDMVMPELDGIETALALRAAGDEAFIICLTSSPDFAVRSYRVNAFDYLIKASEDSEFIAAVAKAAANLARRDTQRLRIKSGTTIHSLSCDEIEYIEVFGKKLSFRLRGGELVESYKPIRELQDELQHLPQFFRIHRSIIVNLAHVSAIDPHYVKTAFSSRLPLARGKYPELETAFLSYLGSRT